MRSQILIWALFAIAACGRPKEHLPTNQSDGGLASPDTGIPEAKDAVPRDADEGAPDARHDRDTGPPDVGTAIDGQAPWDASLVASDAGFAPRRWSFHSGGSGSLALLDMVAAGDGDTILTGLVAGSVLLGPHQVDGEPAPAQSAFWLRLGRGGEVRSAFVVARATLGLGWARLVAFSSGELGLALGYNGQLRLGSPAQAVELSSPASAVAVAKLSADGDVRWARTIEGDLQVSGLAPHPSGGLVVTGSFSQQIRVPTSNAPLVLTTTQGPYPGHGVLLELDPEGLPAHHEIIEGTAGSAIGSAVVLHDGTMIAAGGFGFYPNGLTAVFRRDTPEKVTLTNVSADDDPAFDTFVFGLAPDWRLTFAKRVRSYAGESGPRTMIPTQAGALIQVEAGAYPIVFDEGEPTERRFASLPSTTHAVFAEIAPEGHWVQIRRTAPLRDARSVSGGFAARLAVLGPWWINDGDPDQRLVDLGPLPPRFDRQILVRFSGDGRLAAWAKVEAELEEDGRFEIFRFAALSDDGWVLASDDRGVRTVVGPEGALVFSPESAGQSLLVVSVGQP